MASRIWGKQNSCILWQEDHKWNWPIYHFSHTFQNQNSRRKFIPTIWIFFFFCWVLSSLTTMQKRLRHRWVIQASWCTSSVMLDTPHSDYHSDSGQDKKFSAQCGILGGDLGALTIQLWQKLFCECVSDISSTWKTSFAAPWYEIFF